jgi:hypothetical protein
MRHYLIVDLNYLADNTFVVSRKNNSTIFLTIILDIHDQNPHIVVSIKYCIFKYNKYKKFNPLNSF